MNVLVYLLDHPLAHRFGWDLLHSIWEGALIAIVFAIVRLGLRRRSANVRYLAACAALVIFTAVPIVTFLQLPTAALPTAPTGFAHSTTGYHVRAAAEVSQWVAPSPQYLRHGTELIDRFLPWMVPLWMAGVVGLSFRWIHGSRWIRHIQTSETELLGSAWRPLLQDLCRRLAINRPVRLLKSALIEVPVVVGWLRPVILLPASALAGLTPDQLEAILAHELAHVRRYDYLVNTLQNLVETILFYHPAVWWISRCIREERELCCDDLVVRVCGDRVTYVRALVRLEEARGFPRLALAATGGSLLHRVRRLLGVANESGPPSAAECSGITLGAIGCVFIVAALWLLNSPSIYQASALIKVSAAVPIQTTGGAAGSPTANYQPYFLQTECLVIRSPAVLNNAIQSLGSMKNERPNGLGKASTSDAVKLLKSQLNLLALPSTSVIEIQATDSEPAEAARIANAVAAAYKQYRLEQRRKLLRSAIDTLETRHTEQIQKIRQAEQVVDRLRTELRVPDAVLSENMPAGTENNHVVPFSAETLRHIEGLRIESQAEYVKQRALLDRLEQLDPKDLPATILTIGVQDNQLASLSESQALVDQRLVSLRKELGPEDTEFVKAEAQQADLMQKIKARTSGILLGLQAKCESTAMGLAALSNAVYSAQTVDIATASSSRPYFEAKRNLEELQRFNHILQAKLAQEANDLQLTEDAVELIEEAVAPTQAIAPNRSRATALLAGGILLVLFGCLLARVGRPSHLSLKPA